MLKRTILVSKIFVDLFFYFLLYGKNRFVEVTKHLAKCRSENNFEPIKIIMSDWLLKC